MRNAILIGVVCVASFATVAFTGASYAGEKVCNIAYANDRASTREIRDHEIAHCNGWVHPERHDFTKKGYKANKPPASMIRKPKMKVEELALSSANVKRLCDGHLGCQWFE